MSRQMVATLTAEHLVALDMVENLQASLQQLQQGSDVQQVQEDLHQFTQFMSNIINQHFRQEEEQLFPKLEKSHPQLQDEIQLLKQEHQQLRDANSQLQQQLQTGQPNQQAIIQQGTNLVKTLDTHLHREHRALSTYNGK